MMFGIEFLREEKYIQPSIEDLFGKNFMKNKNILEVCLSDGLGGLEMFVASCYENFSQKSSCHVVVAPQSKLDKFLGEIPRKRVKRGKIFLLFRALKLAKIIDKNEIDIVHFHWNKDSITVVLAKIFSKRKPKIVQSRHMGMTRFKDDLFHRWIYKNIALIHAVTDEVTAQLRKYIPQDSSPEIQRVYLGVAKRTVDSQKVALLREKYNIKDDTFVLGIVGRIEKQKGQYRVIEALRLLKNPKMKLLVVGAGMQESYLRELQDEVVHLGLQGQVVFTGFTQDVAEYMQLFDVNVLATEHETFGLVVIEAMFAGVPVVATAKGGPLEIIDDGVDGFLFDGSSRDLAEKIDRLYRDKKVYEMMQKAGIQKVEEKFSKEKQLAELYDIIEKV